MNLLEKAKVITTPTAYSDGFVHSVKPEIVLGEELVVNGTFDTDSNWAKSSQSTISGGRANILSTDGSYQYIAQTNANYTATQGKILEITLDIVEINSGALKVQFSNGSQYTFPASIGTHTLTILNNGSTGTLNLARVGGVTDITIDNVSVKEKIDADFNFSRGSSATRVNELGYIEDVQIIGGELVTNGDFEEVGSEEVTNGGFDTDSNWTKANGATISEGKGNIIGDGSSFTNLSQPNVFTVGKFYKVSLDAVINSGLGLKVQDGSTNENFGAITTSGTYTFYGKANNSTLTIGRRAGGIAFDSYIDNVSVKEVGQDWTFIGEAEFTASGARIYSSAGSVSGTNQSGILTISNKYRVQYEIISNTNGSLKIQGVEIPSSVGTHSYDFITSVTALEILRNSGVTDITIDNISVKEITDDTDLPRINYEGFTYENGLPVPYSGVGSWLFEPQRTNKVIYSNDFTQSEWNKSQVTLTPNYSVSPDGTQNATRVEFTAGSTAFGRFVQDNLSSSDAPSNTHTVSCYVKSNSGEQTFRLKCTHAGVVDYYSSDLTATEQWQRFEFSQLFTSNPSTNFNVGIINGSDELAKDLSIFGFQLDTSSAYATSYIPTSGTTVTRLADVCNNAGNSDLFDSTEGVLYAEIASLADDGTDKAISISDGTFNNRIWIGYSTSNQRIYALGYDGGGLQFALFKALTDETQFIKVACRFKDNDFSLWVDGELIGTDTSGTVSNAMSSLQFDLGSGGGYFYGKNKMVAVFPYLSNDELECLTGEGYGTFEALAAAYSYTIS